MVVLAGAFRLKTIKERERVGERRKGKKRRMNCRRISIKRKKIIIKSASLTEKKEL
jgi:hypothetical protein